MRDFFDPNGKATVILFATHFRSNLPRISTLKKRLKVKGAAYYQVHSKHGSNLRNLIWLQSEIHGINHPGRATRPVNPTDFALVSDHVYTNDLFKVDYAHWLLGGFWVTAKSLAALHDVLSVRRDMQMAKNRVNSLFEGFDQAVKDLREAKLADPTIENPPIDDLRQLLDGYGDQAIAQANQAVIDWYEAHRWKDRSERPISDLSEIDLSLQSEDQAPTDITLTPAVA
jgi:hypothetical protein